jgi:ADP-heptose:LPS heptosyltransferase
MAAILFLAPADLGEAVLATGALAHMLREGDALTISAEREARALFRACPARISWLHPKAAFSLPQLARFLGGLRYDLLIDARGGLAGRLTPAHRRVMLEPSSVLRHRVEEWAASLGAERPLPPMLWLDDEARVTAAAIAPDAAPLFVLAPGGNDEAKRWPAERFAAVARRLHNGDLGGAQILTLCAAQRDEEIAARIVSSLDADGVPARSLGASLDLLAAAALMERAVLCLGNDNALTHIAAAMGAPTLTLFGPTDERVRAPHGPRARTLRGRPFEAAVLDGRAAMEDVSIDAVESAVLEILRAGGLR